jgi:putative acetyltransferase
MRLTGMAEAAIRNSTPADAGAIEALYVAAFPHEDLLPVVRALLKGDVPVLSLVAASGHLVIGHVVFTPCTLGEAHIPVSLLAPLAVLPPNQRSGIGTAMVRAGLRHSAESGALYAFVLGDPAYYGRFGFEPARDVAPPYPLPDGWQSAWRFVRLENDLPEPRGLLQVPLPWQDRALWSA